MKAQERRIAQQSSEWMEKLRSGTEADRQAFGEWLLESELHVRHYLMMAALDEELRHIDPERRIPVIAEEREVVRLMEDDRFILAARSASKAAPPHRFHGRQLGWWSLAVVFLIASLLFVGPRMTRSAEWQEYQTGLGELRSVVLEDGSVVQLNTQSRVAVSVTNEARLVRLEAGEALFTVHPDSARPFEVTTSHAHVQAIGTQFNVYERAADTVVTVVSGAVEVFAAGAEPTERNALVRLSTGQQAVLGDRRNAVQVTAVDPESVRSWTARELVFSKDSLGHMADEFNRYNSVKFRVVGPKVAQRRYGGRFEANEPQVFADLLRKDQDLEVQQSGGTIIVRERRYGAVPASRQ